MSPLRLCKHLTCDRPADVLWHGSWCGRHAYERFGRIPAAVFEASRVDRNPAQPRAIANARLAAHPVEEDHDNPYRGVGLDVDDVQGTQPAWLQAKAAALSHQGEPTVKRGDVDLPHGEEF